MRWNLRFDSIRDTECKWLIRALVCYSLLGVIRRSTWGLPNTPVWILLSLIVHDSCYMQNATNPIIYYVMSEKFRREFNRIFKCCIRPACQPRAGRRGQLRRNSSEVFQCRPPGPTYYHTLNPLVRVSSGSEAMVTAGDADGPTARANNVIVQLWSKTESRKMAQKKWRRKKWRNSTQPKDFQHFFTDWKRKGFHLCSSLFPRRWLTTFFSRTVRRIFSAAVFDSKVLSASPVLVEKNGCFAHFFCFATPPFSPIFRWCSLHWLSMVFFLRRFRGGGEERNEMFISLRQKKNGETSKEKKNRKKIVIENRKKNRKKNRNRKWKKNRKWNEIVV